jgi:hypothetical protein
VLVYDLETKPLLSHNSKFLLLVSEHTNTNNTKRHDALSITHSITHFAIIFEASGDVYVDHYRINRPYNFKKSLTVLKGDVASRLFSSDFKNLGGYKHKILVYEQIPRVQYKNHKMNTKLTYFIDAVSKVENSKMEYLDVSDLPDKRLQRFRNATRDRKYELTLNTQISFPNLTTKLMTYEEDGYCVFVPFVHE